MTPARESGARALIYRWGMSLDAKGQIHYRLEPSAADMPEVREYISEVLFLLRSEPPANIQSFRRGRV